MDSIKRLVVFYSRSGTTRSMAQALAAALGCDLEEITERNPRTGFLGYMRSVLEALLKRPGSIAAPQRDVAAYDLVIVGTPVWCSSLSSPVRAYLKRTAPKLPDVAFFCCLGGMGSENTFAQMTAVTGKTPRDCWAITQGEVHARTHLDPLARFVKALTVAGIGARTPNVSSALPAGQTPP
ncbi:NAD(P)H-dependent oxidoreductase [Asticcacaulis sp. AC402]|uniref:flavodoxin family protein n=1 Tax=Asticcacaulis sp. AC402 TaxID=1282361 RepID=UPI0012DFC596|nr:NAD(P)H-dependent oxidoreductase [Asticcacaulis sp. AC402]